MANDIMLYSILNTIMFVIVFIIGFILGSKSVKGKIIENPIKVIKQSIETKRASKDDEEMRLLLKNLENYDGTPNNMQRKL